MINVTSVKGYILEEVLAKLIKNAGYDLLGAAASPDHLKNGGNGLQVQGRGAWHQVDVLGQFKWTPPFSFPIRLFLEAKFRSAKIGVPYVRQALGITEDVNQRVSPLAPQANSYLPTIAHRYFYALASTSGFTGEAATLALAHQISLIDLSHQDYVSLLNAVSVAAGASVSRWTRHRESEDPPSRLRALRSDLRRMFSTAPPDESSLLGDEIPSRLQRRYDDALRSLEDEVAAIGELFVGTANGPFVLLLKADDERRFIEYARHHPFHRISIHWSGTVSAGQIWEIRPIQNRQAYSLTFKLPSLIADWILAQDRSVRRSALAAKMGFLSNLSIHRADQSGKIEIFQMQYEAENFRRE